MKRKDSLADYLGTKKIAFVGLVVIFSTLAGFVFGLIV